MTSVLLADHSYIQKVVIEAIRTHRKIVVEEEVRTPGCDVIIAVSFPIRAFETIEITSSYQRVPHVLIF